MLRYMRAGYAHSALRLFVAEDLPEDWDFFLFFSDAPISSSSSLSKSFSEADIDDFNKWVTCEKDY